MMQLQTFFVGEDHQPITDSKGNGIIGNPYSWQTEIAKGTRIKVGDRTFRVADAFFLLSDENRAPGYYVVMREEKSSWFATLSQDNQVLITYSLVSPTIVILVASILLYFFSPLTFWGVVGYVIGPGVALSLVSTGVLISSQFKHGLGSKEPTLVDSYLYATFITLGLLGAVAWWGSIFPPKPVTIFPDDYAAYVDFLRAQFASAFPVIFASLPWLVFVLNFLGLERIAKVFEFLGGRKK